MVHTPCLAGTVLYPPSVYVCVLVSSRIEVHFDNLSVINFNS